jgi:hypothetical protein
LNTPRRAAVLLIGAMLSASLLAGCEEWPRYLHVDDDPDAFVITDRVVVYEDEALDDEQLQDIGEVGSGTEILYYGFLTSCGYDDGASWPEWPLHDLDGDGTPESPLHAGWYGGDVDWLGLSVAGEVSLEGTLEWDNRPAGDTNAPYDPNFPGGTWTEESDIDLVIFSVDGGDRAVQDETGISNDYPEQLSPAVSLADGTAVAIAVACHHAMSTDFSLRLVVQ